MNTSGITAVDIVETDWKGDDIIPFLVEVELVNDSFLRVKESLTRIGIPGKPDFDQGFPTLHQTCHILYKRGRYFICHFKTMFVLDGKENTLVEADIARQNAIINLLQEWNLIKVVSPEMIADPVCSLKTLKVVKYSERDQWKFVSRYDVGSNMRKEAV
jgi:hypothetical protein